MAGVADDPDEEEHAHVLKNSAFLLQLVRPPDMP
jgi:hypothetical protein